MLHEVVTIRQMQQTVDFPERWVKTYRSHSAVAKCYEVRDGLWQTDYTGPLNLTAALDLGRCVSVHTRQAKCTIDRTDGSVRLFHGVAEPDQMNFLIGSPPGCIICSDEAWDQAHEFCRLLARLGVVRVAFRSSELLDALEFSASMLRV